MNANKRSITLDLTKPKAIEIVKRLVGQGRRGDGELPPRRDGQARLGYEALSAINPG